MEWAVANLNILQVELTLEALPWPRTNAVVLNGSEAIVVQQRCGYRNVWEEGPTSHCPGKVCWGKGTVHDQ